MLPYDPLTPPIEKHMLERYWDLVTRIVSSHYDEKLLFEAGIDRRYINSSYTPSRGRP